MKKKILCIVAHPDDEALGLAGTLIKHINIGDIVNIIILSEGETAKAENSSKNKYRLKNAEEWSKFIGCNLYCTLNLPDQMFDTVPKLEIIQKIENMIFKLKPDIIYTHHSGEINHDHQITSHAVLTAIRPMNKKGLKPEVRTFETPSSTDQAPYDETYIFQPNFYVDIDQEWEKKVASLKIYKKEIGKFPHPRSLESIEALSIKRGAESGLKKAEAFKILRKIWS